MLLFDKVESHYEANLRVQIDFFKNKNFHKRFLQENYLKAKKFKTANSQSYSTIKQRLRLEAGSYKFRISLFDSQAKKIKSIESKLDLKQKSKSQNTITNPKFYKGNQFAIKQNALDFNTDYHLAFYSKVKDSLNIKLYLRTKGGELLYQSEKTLMASSYFRFDTLPIPIKNLEEGQYQYQIFVMNKLLQTKTFEVLWWEKPEMLYELDLAYRPFTILLDSLEKRVFENYSKVQKRNHFFAFWDRQIKTQKNKFNPLMAEFYKRVDFVVKEYSTPKRVGYLSDRGKTYLLFGKPVEKLSFFKHNREIQIWSYNEFEKIFVFDENKSDYVLKESAE